MSALLEGLNDRQREAAEFASGPLIVLAGPGTGKTRVITRRIALMIERGVRPDTVAAMTFTNKAAGEMRDRLRDLVGPAGDEINAGTFHSLGLRLLMRFGDEIGLPTRLDLIDSAQRKDLLEQAAIDAAAGGRIPASRLAAGGPADVAARAWQWIERLRTNAVFAEDARGMAASWQGLIDAPPEGWDQERIDAGRARLGAFGDAVEIYARFESECRSRGLATFDDYILLPIRILRESERAAAIVRDETRHLVVDEYQDVNGAQLELLRLLAPPSPSRDICVVGDDDQAIYGFRGSDTRAFEHFAETWPDATTVTLEENYRSAPGVLAGAQRIIEKAETRFDATKRVVAKGERADDDRPIEAVHVDKSTPWGGVIAPMILGDRSESGRAFESYAVIASTHSKLDEIADQLVLAGVPVARSRRPSALDDDAVIDLLEWIRLLIDGEAYAATRLLTRPPLGLARTEAVGLGREYRRVASRARAEDAEAPGFVAWLRDRGDLPDAAERLLARHDELLDACTTAPAHAAIARIIERTGLAHAELLPARERAARIGHLVSVLRYAREAASRIAPPGDLASFWAHYQRLDENEQTFRGNRGIEAEAEAGFEGEGVRLLTAHQSKGLEFDTVFVPNIGAQSGMFGWSRPSDDPELPEELTGEAPAPKRDELRRLFYVAMTRAERRLVLLSHAAKSRSSGLHMFQELAWRGKQPLPTDVPSGGVLLRSDAGVLRDAAEAGVSVDAVDALDAEVAGDPDAARRAIAAARRDARRDAAEALEASDDTGLTAEMLEARSARLARAAAWMGVIARIERGDAPENLPPWLVADTEIADRAARLASAASAAGEGEEAGRGLKPPLHLSYSQIDAYHRCPACYYLKHVLGLIDVPSDAQLVGTVAHAALESFYKRWSEADNEGLPKPTKDDLVRTGRELFFEASARAGGVDRGQLMQVVAQLDAGYDAFHDEQAEIVMIEEKVRLAYTRTADGAALDDEPHTIEAKIDRVDRAADGEGFRIVDYKTGGAWKKLLQPTPKDLQLGIYKLALAESLGLDAEDLTGEASYWLLSTQQAGTLALELIDLDAVRGVIDRAIAGMLAGDFEPKKGCDGACSTFLGGGGPG
ncbi:MAG: ATP-dependent DNA helicase [Planctomycetota bacterium]